jgi:DNA-binding response OmpR family regulator
MIAPAPALTRTILIVEDEVSIAQAVATRLRSEGFAVELAFDGPTGVARTEALRPDLVVLDLMLPGLDGLDVCREIQRHRPVPVLMLTARDSETDLVVTALYPVPCHYRCKGLTPG